ncbi:MAG: hypothetical protein IKV03_02665 [Alphaproteobacteria bacterium]|nr:hypothetical protein [Alphaproteobacteria bacterium]
MTRKQERGAIMLEVLAVLALIGVMGPMIYRQVLSRNQEITNVNIASEMRAIKEAMSAAISADASILAEACRNEMVENAGLRRCEAGEGMLYDAVNEFLPIGMDGIIDFYDIRLYVTSVTLLNGEEYPSLVGVVVGENLASDWSFKRAARIANLIGTDGGIFDGGEDGDYQLTGTGGSWSLSLEDDFPVNSVVATTALDTFDPDLGTTEPNAVAIPGSLAFSNLHAWDYFSVGQNIDRKKCFHLNRRLNGEDGTGDVVVAADTIKHVGTDGCDPLFWVGTRGSSGDNSESGQVYVKNNLYIGRDNSQNKQAFALEAKGAKGYDGNMVDNSRIVVYNIDGNDTLTIDATGKIVSDKTVNIPIKNKATGTVEEKTYNYGLDVANTSVLNDIRLASRGGARLSDILPTYINKVFLELTSSDAHPFQFPIPSWECPEGYARAITVTPLKWGMSQIESIKIPKTSATHSLSVSGTSVTGDIEVPEQTISSEENITQNRRHFMIEIDKTETSANGLVVVPEKPIISVGYKEDVTAKDWTKPSDYKAGEIRVLLQGYCVYVAQDYDPSQLTDNRTENPIPDNLKQ